MDVVINNNAFLGKETKRPSRFFRDVSTIWAIFYREVSVALKSPGMLFMTLAMPLVMMVNMLFMVTSQGISTLVDDRESNFSKEMLIAPVSRYAIVIGKIFGSMFCAIISMAGTLLVGAIMGTTLMFLQFLAVLALSPLVCLSAGALGCLCRNTGV